MPTYEYVCDACGHAFDLFQQMTDPVKRKCPECGKPALRRLIGTGAGIIFRGSGFYQTDYRSDSYRKAAEAEKKSAGGDGAAKPGTPDGTGANKTAANQTAGAAGGKPARPASPGADAGRKGRKGSTKET